MKQDILNNTLSTMNGRFFGLEKQSGEKLNAKVVKITESYVTVNDRNSGNNVKLKKDNIKSLTIAGKTIK